MPRARIRHGELAAFLLILALAALLRLLSLWRNGIGNPYYAAGALSMSLEWTLFLFGSFDPGGFVSQDKPPVGFWPSALSIRLFGLTPLSVHLPQALAGLLTIFTLWRFVRRVHGPLAGLFAALFLALTPIAVAVDRSNIVDPWLTLPLTLAASLSWRRRGLLSGGLLGIGFCVKLFAAPILLPAVLAAWAFDRERRLRSLLAFFAAFLAVASAWPLLIALTPPTKRPYVGGSRDNTATDLLLGYNGLGRVLGRSDQMQAGMRLPPLLYGGTPGPGRLFEPRLGDGWAWQLPLALLGTIALARARRWRALALWSLWLGAHVVLFSGAKGTFHVHYLSALGPPAAALAGVGAAWGLRLAKRRKEGPYLLCGLLLLSLLWQSVLIARGADARWQAALAGALWPLGAGTILWMLWQGLSQKVAGAPWLLGLATLLIAPLAWSLATLRARSVSVAPFAGPQLLAPRATLGIEQPFSPRFIRFLQHERRGARYLLAVGSSRQASPLILATHQPVMTTGGFLGRDPILTPQTLADLAAKGVVRFVLLDADLQPALARWTRQNGRRVDPSLFRGGDPRCQDTYYELFAIGPAP